MRIQLSDVTIRMIHRRRAFTNRSRDIFNFAPVQHLSAINLLHCAFYISHLKSVGILKYHDFVASNGQSDI